MGYKKVLALALSITLVVSTGALKTVKAEGVSTDYLYSNAYKATETAIENKSQISINAARTAVNLLPENLSWAIGEFSKQIDKIQQPIFEKAYNAIAIAKKNPSQANINTANAAIDPDMPEFYRNSYSSAVDKIQQDYMKKALDTYKTSITSKLQVDVDKANELFADIKTSTNPAIRNWVDLAQTLGDNRDLSDGGIHVGNYAISFESGTFGYSNSFMPTTIKGNILINNNNGNTIILQNMNIDGILSINFGSGDVVLDNVNVNGVTVTNVGANSLHVKGNTVIKNLNVNDSNDDAHIVVEENGSIANVNALSGVKLEAASNSVNGKAFGNVTVSGANMASDNSKVILDGVFNIVSITSPNASVEMQGASVDTVVASKDAIASKINLSYDSNINKLNINAPITVTGTGNITTANIGATWTTIVPMPNNIALLASVTATVGGTTRNSSNTTVINSVPVVTIPNTNNSGSGTGTGGSNVPVDTITVSQSNYTLNYIGATVAIAAYVSPSNASNKNITWTSSSDAVATVSNGVVTAKGPGTATIKATSVSDSTKFDTTFITVIPNIIITNVRAVDVFTVTLQSSITNLSFAINSLYVNANPVTINNQTYSNGVYTIKLNEPLSTALEYKIIASKANFIDGTASITSSIKNKYITNVQDLESAVASQSDGETWYISAGTYAIQTQLSITKAVSFEPLGAVTFKAVPNGNWSTVNGEQYLFAIYGGTSSVPVKIKNIIIDADNKTQTVYAANNAYATLQDVTIKNGTGAGLLINGSTITANNLNTNNNALGAVNVDPSSGVTTPTVFTLNSGNLNEARKIWSDGTNVISNIIVTVNASGYNKYALAGRSNAYIWTNLPLQNAATITRGGKTILYPGVQAAVNDANSGETINVAAGTYTEQIIISGKDITIKGVIINGVRLTTIKSIGSLIAMSLPSDVVRPVISITNSRNFSIIDIVVDGNSNGLTNVGFTGIGAYNSTGNITNCEIKNVNEGINNVAQNGTGIYAYNDSLSHVVSINNNFIHEYSKNGIIIKGIGLTGNISSNTVIGQGPYAISSQNGIQFISSIFGTVKSNMVSGNINGQNSIGILLSHVTSTKTEMDIRIDNPGISSNSINVLIN